MRFILKSEKVKIAAPCKVHRCRCHSAGPAGATELLGAAGSAEPTAVLADDGKVGLNLNPHIIMPRGSKSSYSSKQKRQASHIEEGYEKRGVGKKEAEERAWRTVNKRTGGAKKKSSGRKKSSGTKRKSSSRSRSRSKSKSK